jgi:hypothetical protein
VALIAEASNREIDRLNARAQHLRVDRGELGGEEIELPAFTTGCEKATSSHSRLSTGHRASRGSRTGRVARSSGSTGAV